MITEASLRRTIAWVRSSFGGEIVLRPRGLAVVVIAVAASIGWLATSLPADAFFSGDSGLKLLAALNAIDHPARPFEFDLPQIGGTAGAVCRSNDRSAW